MPRPTGLSLTAKVLIGMGLGVVAGLAINLTGPHAEGGFVQAWLVDGLFGVVGRIFVNALTMLVVPLVFFSLVCGVCGIGHLRVLGRVGLKSLLLYLMTTGIAVSIAIAAATGSGIGRGMEIESDASFVASAAPSFIDVLVNLVPRNPIDAMARGEMLQVICFALLVGVSIVMVGRKAAKLVAAFEIGNEIMMKMVMIVMAVAPYAVFALLARAISQLGFDLLASLLGYVLVVAGTLLLHLFVVLPIVLRLFTGLPVRAFLAKMRNVQLFAFSTSSSNATIPVTMRTVTQRLGVDNSVASFTVPFGATVNMDGTAIMQGVATIFIAAVYGVELDLVGYLTVIAMAVLASIGAAGVPGVGLILLSMVFLQVGLPVEGIGLIIGVDRILDMMRTSVNVTGDAVVSVIVARSERRFDESIYRDPEAGLVADAIAIDEAAEAELAKVVESTRTAQR
jgi:Na+/H+-dicarboxylate symporter